MAHIAGRNPLEKSLNESMMNLIEEKHGTTVKDRCVGAHKDSIVRNNTHQEFSIHNAHIEDDEGGAHELEHREVWLNKRTGRCHEGSMLVHNDGRSEPHSHVQGAPTMYHSSHYCRLVN